MTRRARSPWRYSATALLLSGLLAWLLITPAALLAATPRLAWELLDTLPHHGEAFTQGLVLEGDVLYESSGRYRMSYVERRDLASGEVLARFELPRIFFAEGITLFNDALYLLTWREQRGFVLDPETLEVRERFRYRGEGWGLTHNGCELIMSDGSPMLRFIDPQSFRTLRHLAVRERGRPLANINALQWVDGWLLANIWTEDELALIDPGNGEVAARIDLAALYPRAQRRPGDDVLNGIAHDPRDGSLLVTGKLWPWMYRIQVALPPAPGTMGASSCVDEETP